MNLYRQESSNPKTNAQRNLIGRTHYVDDDSLRFHKSRVLQAREHDGGLLFSIITSDALDMNNAKRGFRFVIFDVFGTVLARPDLENAARTSEQASKWRYAALDGIAARTHTLDAIERQRASAMAEYDRLAKQVIAMGDKAE